MKQYEIEKTELIDGENENMCIFWMWICCFHMAHSNRPFSLPYFFVIRSHCETFFICVFDEWVYKANIEIEMYLLNAHRFKLDMENCTN